MTSFEDNAGRKWVLEVTVGTIKQIRSRCDVDLLVILDDQAALLGRLAADLMLLVDCIWVVIEAQAEAAEISPDEFAASLGGDALGDAAAAFWESVADFFPDPAVRRAMRTLIEKLNEAGEQLLAATQAKLENLDLVKSGEPVTSSPE